MFEFFSKMINNKKGFTIIELIVVLAILVVIAAIAIPNFKGVEKEATIKADIATASTIAKAARLQEAVTGKPLTKMDDFDTNYYEGTKVAQSGGNFTLTKNGNKYEVSFTVDSKTYKIDENGKVTKP